MKNLYTFLVIGFLACFDVLVGQNTIIYENSFRNYQPNQGWIMVEFDTNSQTTPGQIINSLSAEILDYGLGVPKQAVAPFQVNVNKLMISPPISLNDSSFVQFFSNRQINGVSTPVNFSFWILPNPNDTLLTGQLDSISQTNLKGFNIFNLSNYANTTVRLVFKITGIIRNVFPPNRPAQIDDLVIFDQNRLGYIPDTCFRNYLQLTIPNAFIGDSLNFTHEDVVKLRKIECPNSCITSLEGIDYFPGLTTLMIVNNQLNNIPVRKLNYLDSFYVNKNFLEVVPNVPWARYLDYSNNLVRNIPNFSNQNLRLLNNYSNQIYDCLYGSNRFALGNLSNNVRVYKTCCIYYYLNFGNSVMFPIPPIPDCKQEGTLIHGKVYYDQNNNEELDVNDYVFPNAYINVLQSVNLFSNSQGNYSMVIDSGNVTMNVENLPAFSICTNPLDTTVGFEQNLIHNFRVIQTVAYHDLSVSLNGPPIVNLTQTLPLQITANNLSPFVESCEVKIEIPDGLTLVPNPNFSINGDTLTWSIILPPFGTNSSTLFLNADTSLTNQNRFFQAIIHSLTDENPLNDTSRTRVFFRNLNQVATNVTGFPFDPNNKLVSTPVVDSGFVDFLTYTINFENIGTGNATHVTVRDRLSSMLDPNTFQFLGSTHPCIATFALDSILQFTLSPISLTPTSLNPDSSHGTIWFKIKPKLPMNYGDTIVNMASIIFDTQYPINTNNCKVWVDDSREADFTCFQDSMLCAGDTIQFNDLSSGLPLNWEWTFNGGNITTSVERYPKVVFNTAGNYDVKLITNWAEKSDTILKSNFIHVYQYPTNEVEVIGALTLCEGDSTILEALDENSNYLWSNGDTSRVISVKSSNTYSVTVINLIGCSITSSSIYIQVNSLPSNEISTSGPINFCRNDSVMLIANQANASYIWSDGSNGQTISVFESGAKNVTITDTNGCANTSVTYNVEVFELPNPIIVSDTIICSGTSALIGTSTTFQSYLWSSGENSPTILKEAGVYSLEVIDSNGCIGNTALTINSYPLVDFTLIGENVICEGDTAQILCSAIFLEYNWSNTDSTNIGSFESSGTYFLETKDQNNCMYQDSITIFVNNKPIVVINGDTSFCEGKSLTINSNSNFNSYLWSSGETASEINISTSGTYSLEVSDSNGCINSASLTIIENQNPEFTIAGNFYFCENESTILEVLGNFSNVNWSNGTSNPTITIDSMGTYSLIVSNTFNCISRDTIIIEKVLLLDVSISGFNNDTICNGSESYILVGNPVGGIFSGDGLVGNTFVTSNANLGINTITYTYSDSLGCENFATKIIYVDNCTAISPTNTDNYTLIFPNPTQSIVFIKLSTDNTIEGLKVINSIGQTLIEQKDVTRNENYIIVDLSSLSAGLYFVNIENSGKIEYFRVIKE